MKKEIFSIPVVVLALVMLFFGSQAFAESSCNDNECESPV